MAGADEELPLEDILQGRPMSRKQQDTAVPLPPPREGLDHLVEVRQ